MIGAFLPHQVEGNRSHRDVAGRQPDLQMVARILIQRHGNEPARRGDAAFLRLDQVRGAARGKRKQQSGGQGEGRMSYAHAPTHTHSCPRHRPRPHTRRRAAVSGFICRALGKVQQGNWFSRFVVPEVRIVEQFDCSLDQDASGFIDAQAPLAHLVAPFGLVAGNADVLHAGAVGVAKDERVRERRAVLNGLTDLRQRFAGQGDDGQ